MSDSPDFRALLDTALTTPGLIQKAYSAFYGYSLGNQMLAMSQCMQREITPGPIATFTGWKGHNRSVRKGQKAIMLCMPITMKRKATAEPEPGTDPAEPGKFTMFVYKNNWFVLSQTDGPDEFVDSRPAIAWDREMALSVLNVTEHPFDHMDGNCQGYARERSIAISPVADMPEKTRFHELAHIVLGHTAEHTTMADNDRTPRSLREVEAEAVAMLCLESLGLPGSDYCRGYIQHWNQHGTNEPISEKSAQKIFKTADQILKAGIAKPEAAVE